MGFLDNAGLTTLWNKIVGKSIPYGYCQTAKGTVAKTVTVSPAITELTTGLTVLVRFQYENTSTNPTLKVNTTDAKAIKRYGTTAAGTSAAASWQAGEVCVLTYNGTYWMLANWNNTTYSGMTDAEVTAGTGTSNRLITPARLKTAIQTWGLPNTTVIPTKTSDLTNDDGFTSVSWNQITGSGGTKIAEVTIDGTTTDVYAPSGGMSRESDPVFTASPAHQITSNDIANWNSAEANVQVDWNETDSDSDSFILNKPTLPYRYIGDTATDTPTDVWNELLSSSSGGVSINHTDSTYGALRLDSFDYSLGFGAIVSTTSIYYNGSYLLYVLVGYLNTDTWQSYVTTLAQASDIPTVPTNVSAFTNDAGYITGYTETDPTVPAWAKASSKPSYTASEVGALANTGGQVTGDITLYVASGNSPALIFQRGTLTDNYNDWKIYDKSGFLYFAQRGSGSSAFGDVGYINTSGVAYFHVPWSYIDSKPTIPTKTSDLTNDSGFLAGVTAPDVQFQAQGTNYLDNESEVDGALNALDSAIGTIADDCDNINYGQTTVAGALNDLYTKTLPSVTSSDNGKVLRVVNGAWSAVALPSASGVSF